MHFLKTLVTVMLQTPNRNARSKLLTFNLSFIIVIVSMQRETASYWEMHYFLLLRIQIWPWELWNYSVLYKMLPVCYISSQVAFQMGVHFHSLALITSSSFSFVISSCLDTLSWRSSLLFNSICSMSCIVKSVCTPIDVPPVTSFSTSCACAAASTSCAAACSP